MPRACGCQQKTAVEVRFYNCLDFRQVGLQFQSSPLVTPIPAKAPKHDSPSSERQKGLRPQTW